MEFSKKDLLKIFSVKSFESNDDNTLILSDELTETNNLINSIMNKDLMTTEEIFESYTFLLSCMDYLNTNIYKFVCEKCVNFINQNLDILIYDWNKETPLICQITKSKIEKLQDIENIKLTQRINQNYNYFIKYMQQINKLKILSKNNELLDILNITEFVNEYGESYEEIE